MRGTIDGTDVFLSEDQLPEFTLSVNDIEDPSKVKGARSTTVRIINTPEAARVLGTEYMVQEVSTQRPRLRIGEGSGELFSANVIPVRRSRNEIECITEAGNASWFEYAKKTKLRQMDLGKSELVDNTLQESTWTDQDSKLYFPLIDFGGLEARASTYNVTEDMLRPAWRLHSLINDAMAPSGWKFHARGSLASVWKKYIVMDPAATPSIAIPSPFPYTWLADLSAPNPNTYYFVPSANGLLDVDLTNVAFEIPDLFDPEYDGVAIRISVYDFTDKLHLASFEVEPKFYPETGYGQYVITHSFTAVPVTSGHNIGIGIQALGLDGQATTFSVVAGAGTRTITYDLNAGAQTLGLSSPTSGSFTITDGLRSIAYSSQKRLELSQVAPNVTLDKIISGIANAQRLVFDTNDQTKVVSVWFDTEYFRKPSASEYRDWTDRLDHSQAPIKNTPSRPSSVILKWTEDDGDRMLRRADLASGSDYGFGSYQRDFPNNYGKELSVEVPFAASVMGTVFGTCTVPVMRKTGNAINVDAFDRDVRLFIADGLASGNWRFDGVDKTQYPKCYFTDPTAPYPLPFGNLGEYLSDHPVASDQQWSRYINEEAQSNTLEAYFFIRDHEIQDFDHGLPTLVNDGSGPRWYYVQEILGHRFGLGAPTKCILVEIPGAEVSQSELVNPVVEFPVQPIPIAFTFSSQKNGSIGAAIQTSSGYFSVRDPLGNVTTYPSGFASLPDPGGVDTIYEVWASNMDNVPLGFIEGITINAQDVTSFTPLNLGLAQYAFLINDGALEAISTATGMEAMTVLSIAFTGVSMLDLSGSPALLELNAPSIAIESLDLSTCPVIRTIDTSFASALETVVPPPGQTLHSVIMSDCALNAGAVSSIVSACDPSFSGGTLSIEGGSSAAPSGADLSIINALVNGSGLTVSGAGASSVNHNDYTLTTQLNGRDRYTRTGVFIFWNGSKWRIQSGAGDIYEGTEDVMQPWLVTTWTPIGGTASPVPILTQPYAGGWTVTTN